MKRTVLFTLAVACGGCLAEDSPTIPDVADSAEPDGWSEERPCGDNTVAVIQTDDGNTLTFCATASGAEIVSETGLSDVSHVAAARATAVNDCALAVYDAVAIGRPVPGALLDTCADDDYVATIARSRVVVDGPWLEARAAEEAVAKASYCFAPRFRLRFCRAVACGPDTDRDECYAACSTNTANFFTADTLVSYFNSWGDRGEDYMVSCNGGTRHLGQRRKDLGSAWVSEYSANVGAGAWHMIWMQAGSFDEDDFRFERRGGKGSHHFFALRFND